MQNAEVQNRRNPLWVSKIFARAFCSSHPGFCLLVCFWTSAFCILHSAFSAPVAGAQIDESKVAKTYYVDPAGANAADDNEHGTQDAPFLTIKRALDAALRDKDANAGARVIIAPGTYRESIDIPAPANKAADTDAPLVIEAAERDQTIIDAADTAGWEIGTWTTEGAILTHRWPFSTDPPSRAFGGRPPNGSEPSLRSAGIFVDGTALRPVGTAAALVPGTFWIAPSTDRRSPNAAVHVQLPADIDPDGAIFQVSARGHGVEIIGRRNVVVRGLLLQHAANPNGAREPGATPSGLVLNGCSNVLVEDMLSQWNAGTGLDIEGHRAAPWSEGFTLRRVRLIHNGQSGLTAFYLKNLLAEDCETSFNNVHDENLGSVVAEGAAGVRAGSVHGSTWRRQHAVANFARGMWWTTDCTDLLVEDAIVHDNLFGGLFIQDCPGPSVVRGCLVTGSRLLASSKPEVSQPAGVSFEASPDVTLENNVVAGNLMPQLGLRDVAERADGVDFETGAHTKLRAERHVYRHNAFYGADADQPLVNLPVTDHAGKSDFAFYYATLDSDENCFWNPASPEVFCTYDRTAYRRPGMALAGWRTFLSAHANAGNGGQGDRRPEAGSLWDDPRFMEPGEGDYRLQAQSPLIDWGLPAEEGGAAQ